LAAPWALEVWRRVRVRSGQAGVVFQQHPFKCSSLSNVKSSKVLTPLFLLHDWISPNHVSNECGARKIKSFIWAEDLLGSYGRASAHAGIEAAREICRLFAVHVLVC
jgi:hypothetical protein